MPDPGILTAPERHRPWVRLSHWLITASFLTLAFTGYVILMSHPRLYWGDAGNDLTPAWLELPISRNYHHGGWTQPVPFAAAPGAPVSASRTFDIFNQNGWGRSLHFLAAWFLVVPGLAYLLAGLASGHFRRHLVAGAGRWPELVRDWRDHLAGRIRAATGGPTYGPLQRVAYLLVIFGALPLMVLTGLAMSPAVSASYPFLLRLCGGFQSARSLHFLAFVALLAFLGVHVAMVVKSGFRRQLRAMTWGE